MESVRIYRSSAFHLTNAFGHVYIYSPDTKTGIGMASLNPNVPNPGVDNPRNNSYRTLKLPEGMTAKKFMKKVESYPGWHQGMWIVYVNDCHTQLEKAIEYAGVPYEHKHARIDFSKTFTGDSYVADAAKISSKFFQSIVKKADKTRSEIAELIIKKAKSDHKFNNNTGRLSGSITYRHNGNMTDVYASADYAEKVMVKTNNDFITDSAMKIQPQIEQIISRNIEQSLQEDQAELDRMVEDYGYKLLKNQFDQI